MDFHPEGFNNAAFGGRNVSHPNLTKQVQSRNPRVEGGRLTRPGTREMRRAAERFHKKQSKKNK